MKLAVEIEDIESWPKEFRKEAVKNKSLLISYHKEYSRISRLCEDDIISRVHPPHNEHETEYRALADSLESILLKHNIVGYHCTRLTAREMTSITEGGLKILTQELVQRRLDDALNDGHLSKKHISDLRNNEILKENLDNKHGGRTGMIWFCPNRSSLKEYSGVYRLFRSWGGEAVYRGHENDDPLSQAIRQVGTPCIVKCALPFYDTEHFCPNYAERFLSYLVSDTVEYPEPPVGFDMYAKRDLISTEVLEIFDISHSEFERLIDYKRWKNDYPLLNSK